MANITYPNTFTAGTTARASEMNENFDAVSAQVNGSLEAANLANGAVTAIKLAADAVTTAKILDANVTEAKLAANAVATAKVADGAITAAKMAANSVATASIVDGAVTAAKLATTLAGTFTPGFNEAVNPTVNTARGTYSRLGNLVTFEIYFQLTENSAGEAMGATSNALTVTGLPFTSANIGVATFLGSGLEYIVPQDGSVSRFGDYVAVVNPGATTIRFRGHNVRNTLYHDGDTLAYDEVFLSGDGPCYFVISGSYVAVP